MLSDTRRVPLLWIGLGTYVLIVLNDFRYIRNAPYYLIVVGFLLNLAILYAFIYELRKTYKRLRNEKQNP